MVAMQELTLARGGLSGSVQAHAEGKQEGHCGYRGPAASYTQGRKQSLGVSDGETAGVVQRLVNLGCDSSMQQHVVIEAIRRGTRRFLQHLGFQGIKRAVMDLPCVKPFGITLETGRANFIAT